LLLIALDLCEMCVVSFSVHLGAYPACDGTTAHQEFPGYP